MFLGDYIDRGPDSRQTIDLLIERGRRHEASFLKGNHEAFLLEVFQDTARLEAWKDYGGFQTLMSYGLAPSLRPDREEQAELVQALQIAMPAEHRQFFRSLRKSFVCGDFFFAHAGAPNAQFGSCRSRAWRYSAHFDAPPRSESGHLQRLRFGIRGRQERDV